MRIRHVALVGALALLASSGIAIGQNIQQLPLPSPPQASCETQLQVWMENGTNFFHQLITLEGQNRELLKTFAAGTKEGDTVQPPQPSHETQLQVWRENGSSFFRQLMTLEGQNRELLKSLVQVSKERDEARAKHSSQSAPTAPVAENKP